MYALRTSVNRVWISCKEKKNYPFQKSIKNKIAGFWEKKNSGMKTLEKNMETDKYVFFSLYSIRYVKSVFIKHPFRVQTSCTTLMRSLCQSLLLISVHTSRGTHKV